VYLTYFALRYIKFKIYVIRTKNFRWQDSARIRRGIYNAAISRSWIWVGGKGKKKVGGEEEKISRGRGEGNIT